MNKQIVLILLVWHSAYAAPLTLTDTQAREIGNTIWHNECGKSVEKLIWWNAAEDFPSLGIGHFIWFPTDYTGPFTQTFDQLLLFLHNHGVQLPAWLTPTTACPWPDRASFYATHDSDRMQQLRTLLRDTVNLQTQFMIKRVHERMPTIINCAPKKRRNHIKKQFSRLEGTPHGCYVLVDYLNFKGDGTSPRERYNDQGWGLLQVLDTMRSECTQHTNAADEFAACATNLLEQRVENAGTERNEKRWLPGWKKRIQTYQVDNADSLHQLR